MSKTAGVASPLSERARSLLEKPVLKGDLALAFPVTAATSAEVLVAGKAFYLRTRTHLYRIENKTEKR